MSNLEPSVVALDSGLNLQTAKIIAPPGSVLDTLNYEQVDFQGQKRIDGYGRYDGSLLGTLDEYQVVTLDVTPAWTIGDVIVDVNDNVIAILLAQTAETVSLAIIDFNRVPETDDVLYRRGTDGPENTAVVVTSELGKDVETDVEVHYQNLLSYSTILRNKVENLPGGIIGLQWFRDRLYAVADVTTVFLDGTTPQIFPEDVLETGGFGATVLDSFIGDGVRVVFLDTMNPAPWYLPNVEVTRSLTSVGFTTDDEVADVDVEAVASFFESRTEQQAVDEDVTSPNYGWRFRHLGWEVLFEDGISLFGSLPSTNQNIEGIGVQGPTSTTGNNGRPLILLQKVNITNVQTQVNGWKSTQTPTSYLLDPDDLSDIDSDYTYADGYITWDGTSGQVTALGASSGTLVEYAATATVEVEV